MKPLPFVLAIFCGKLVQFLVCSVLTIWFGPALLHSLKRLMHQHLNLVTGVGVAALFWLVLFVVRKVFDKRKGVELPGEEA